MPERAPLPGTAITHVQGDSDPSVPGTHPTKQKLGEKTQKWSEKTLHLELQTSGRPCRGEKSDILLC